MRVPLLVTGLVLATAACRGSSSPPRERTTVEAVDAVVASATAPLTSASGAVSVAGSSAAPATSAADRSAPALHAYEAKLGEKAVLRLVLETSGGRLEGLSTVNGSATALRGEVVAGGILRISEVAPRGKPAGVFEAIVDGDTLKGAWKAADAPPVPFTAGPLVLAGKERAFKQTYVGLLGSTTHLRAQIERSGDRLSGFYRYSRSQENLRLEGTVRDVGGAFSLEERSAAGAVTGVWNGVFLDATQAFGRWTSPDGSKSFPFTLSFGYPFPSSEALPGGARVAPEEDFAEPAPHCTLSLFFPQVTGLANAAAAKALNAALRTAVDDGETMSCDGAGESSPYEKQTSYTLDAKRPGALALHYGFNQYTGGAHPTYFGRCFVADLETGALTRTTAKLLPPETRRVLEAKAIPAVKKRYAEAEMPWTRTGPLLSDATAVCVSGEDLVVEFQPYEVTPYSLGAPEVRVPRAEAGALVAGTPLERFFR